MGKDLARDFELARRRYAEAAAVLGFDLAAVCFEGSDDELRQTRVTQPALYVHSCILTELLAEQGISPTAAAGHSLGEYSALFSAGAFSFADGLRLVKARAEAMQQAGTVESRHHGRGCRSRGRSRSRPSAANCPLQTASLFLRISIRPANS